MLGIPATLVYIRLFHSVKFPLFKHLDRWQGYHITLHCKGVKSFLKCIPESIATRLHEVVPDPIDGGIENHVVTVHEHLGNVLFSKLNNQFTFIVIFSDRLRDLLFEGIDGEIYYLRVLTCNG